jgi:hypothetical protein
MAIRREMRISLEAFSHRDAVPAASFDIRSTG